MTIKELLVSASQYPKPTVLNDYINNTWRSYSTSQFLEEVKFLALALHNKGLNKGDRVGIMASSSARWTIADLACMSIGLVTVPLFANLSEENFLYEVQHTELKAIFLGGPDTWSRYEESKDLFHIGISLENDYPGHSVLYYRDMIDLGRRIDEENRNLYEELCNQVKPNDLATIIFTSGSTGIPKGAEHTHKSITAHLGLHEFWRDDDVYLSILPLAHVFGRTVNLILVNYGVQVNYFNDLKNVSSICKQIHPTLITLVPRLLEKIYRRMVEKIETAGYLKRAIGKWAFDLALQEEETTWKHIFHPIAEKLVYSQLREALGGKLRVAFSGGAALDPHLHHFFLDIGLPIFEGWGQTEICPGIINIPGKTKVGSIGTPTSYVKIKLSPEGELLIKSDAAMQGYFRNPEATALAFDEEGWLRTGDLASIDEEGFVTLKGRIKEIIKTSNAEMIAPVPIEQAIAKAPFIDLVMIVAEHRKFVSCLIVPDFETLQRLKQTTNKTDLSDEEFLNDEYIKNEMENLLKEVNSHLNHWEEIRTYRFITHPLTIDSGELTPSLKIVRKIVELKYKDLIDSMYEEAENFQEVR